MSWLWAPRFLMPDTWSLTRQPLRQQMQIALAITECFERAYGFQHVIAIGPGLAVALPHMMQTLRQRQPAGILHVAAIDDVAHRPHTAPGTLFELDLPHRFDIDRRDLLARAQIAQGRGACRGGDPIGDAAAHSAAIKPEHEAGPLGRAAMDKGEHAERTVQPDQSGGDALAIRKSRPPHQ